MNIWIIVAVFIAASIYLYISRKSLMEEEYERIAGKPIALGKDSVPKRFKGVSFKILSVIRQKEFGNSYQKCIIVCETLPVIMLYDTPETFTFIKWVRNGTVMHEGNAFNISETGELEFNIQPNV